MRPHQFRTGEPATFSLGKGHSFDSRGLSGFWWFPKSTPIAGESPTERNLKGTLSFCDCGPAEGGHAAMGLSALVRYDQAHGEMHSTSTRASLSGCCGGVPRVRWPWRLPRLQQLLPVLLVSVVSVLLVSVLLLGGEWRQRTWLVRRQRKGALVARRFVRGVYAC
jgi:hypothetical protein